MFCFWGHTSVPSSECVSEYLQQSNCHKARLHDISEHLEGNCKALMSNKNVTLNLVTY